LDKGDWQGRKKMGTQKSLENAANNGRGGERGHDEISLPDYETLKPEKGGRREEEEGEREWKSPKTNNKKKKKNKKKSKKNKKQQKKKKTLS